MTMAAKMSLNNGVLMDQLGFGVYKVPPATTADLCTLALETGYRHLDTAALYGNEAGVGAAVRAAVGSGFLSREDIFVTTKVWNDSQGFDATLAAYEKSLVELGLDYADLYLIHWPCPAQGRFVETYKAMERLYQEGRVRAIGVSNFQVEHLRQLMDTTEVVPAVNQIELHPWLQQEELRAFHSQYGIRTEAWSPLGRGSVLADPELQRLASALGKSPAQVVIRWHLQLGNIVIPKASSRHRIEENFAVQDFSLDSRHMRTIASLDRNHRTGSHPNEVN
jgi:2,5-diketo-D-gluconate reductase A